MKGEWDLTSEELKNRQPSRGRREAQRQAAMEWSWEHRPRRLDGKPRGSPRRRADFFPFADRAAYPSQIEHLYGLTVFENYLYATNSDNANAQQKTSVIRVNRFNSTDYQVVTRVDKGGALHIYHQRRQPRGEQRFFLWEPPILSYHDCFS